MWGGAIDGLEPPTLVEARRHRETARQDLRDLFGDSRWGTIRSHASVLRREDAQHSSLIPWTDESLSRILNLMEVSQVHPRRPVKLVESLSFISDRTGFQMPPLLPKAKRIRRTLTRNLLRASRRAAEPDWDDIVA